MKQVVIYLTPSQSYYVYQTAFEIPGTRHEFEVIHLWEQPTQPFLESTGLLPLAVLTNTPDQAQTLRQVAERIDAIPELRIQSNVAASAGILSGLTLERDFINQVLRKEIMQQSVIYQEWKEQLISGFISKVEWAVTHNLHSIPSTQTKMAPAFSLTFD